MRASDERELWPTQQAKTLQTSLTEYLTTTFALSDHNAEEALKKLLTDPEHGMFKGPYIRTRLPFISDDSLLNDDGKPTSLDVYPSEFKPYGHQAQAFQRLSTKPVDGETFRTPQPTVVTTGTGSGKTEAFLYPILDHVIRAQKAGISGIKALILYPMNALANDQAARLTELINNPNYPVLGSIRAGLYTGQDGPKRKVVTDQGLINDRTELRKNPPDILLTNYKMLDQLLLRAEDANLWKHAGISLQYLVLDEFHTYDGAQGTDVAMLLRRLGAVLKADAAQYNTSTYAPTPQQLATPLGKVTPVATSATMGGNLDPDEPSPMLEFAKTIFGVEFSYDAVVEESRLPVDQWLKVHPSVNPVIREEHSILAVLEYVVGGLDHNTSPDILLREIARLLFETPPSDLREHEYVLELLKAHPWVQRLVRTTQTAVSLATIREAMVGQQPQERHSVIESFISHLLAALSHLRSTLGRDALTVETHLWVREVSRLDSPVDSNPEFLWSDDGAIEPSLDTADLTETLPAIFCRHCGKRGWAALRDHNVSSVNMKAHEIRRAAVSRDSKFLILLDAEDEATKLEDSDLEYATEPRLRFFDLDAKALLNGPEITVDDRTNESFRLVAVKTYTELEDPDLVMNQTCPNCDTPDAIRFVGSAIATLLSVAITGLFGTSELRLDEKKALVFTDSVQDAAHRAGFIQARSHTFTLRTVLRQALDEAQGFGSVSDLMKDTLPDLVDLVMERAERGADADKFILIPPDLLDHEGFTRYWNPASTRAQHNSARENVKRRLLFDAELEFGLQARFGRTLELTGTVVVEADAGQDTELHDIATAALERLNQHQVFDLTDRDSTTWQQQLTQWVRGVLIRIRLQGGIGHEWLQRYWETQGLRWQIWGGRNRAQGMPAFPLGRSAPRFPVADGRSLPKDSNFDPISSRQSWYTWWTRQTVNIPQEQAGHWTRALFDELVDRDVLTLAPNVQKNKVYVLPPERILLQRTSDADLNQKKHTLECDLCKAKTFGTHRIIQEMTKAPCLNRRCTGALIPVPFDGKNYYRDTLYSASRTTRVVAREHTAMLEDEERLQYEQEFRSDQIKPTSPNVLVATPTLEMGIDIGTLSTVMLSSMPRSVANYIQRVGRAGRTSGNSLIMAFVQGRGEHLPKLNDPLSIINGEVTPPSTYLSADEILRRQFMAFCGDILARGGTHTPRNLEYALGSTAEGSYLRAMMDLVVNDGETLLNTFFQQFGSELPDPARDNLRTWVLRDANNPASESPLESRLHLVSATYLADKREMHDRKHHLQNTQIPHLQQAVDHALKTSGKKSDPHREAERALGVANGTLKALNYSINQLFSDHWWISGMERYGIFPNYSLFDESVELSARVSYLNEDSQEWEAEVIDLSRGAAAAIQEFAPGATFYAQGLEIDIDAVELGPDQRHLAHWQICPDCGWVKKDLVANANDDNPTNFQGFVTSCTRCGTLDIGDQGQILPVVDLKKVSAEIRRDEARISDRRDERAKTSFHIHSTADLDDAKMIDQWYLKDYPFGMELYSEADLHWYNFGLRTASGESLQIAGETPTAPLFQICMSCGVLRKKTQINSEKDHRYWCQLRNAVEADSKSVALVRHLKTQAVRIHVSSNLLLDDYSLPTLRAALLLGMRRAFGGNPEHLEIMSLVEDQRFASQGYSQHGLLLHDTVPGGTGYLAEFADPQRVRKMLEKAYEVVINCSCQTDEYQRQACHNCLLPHAKYNEMDLVSRDIATRILAQLLASGQETNTPQDAIDTTWQVSEQPLLTEHRDADSQLEVTFREELKKRLEHQNVSVKEYSKNGYLGFSFALHGKKQRWQLNPQQLIDNTVKPDYVLSAPGIPPVAIFVDGRQYHATQSINRIRDDVQKRRALRFTDNQYIPWAITHRDIAAFQNPDKAQDTRLPQLSADTQREAFINFLGVDKSLIQAAQRSSMDLLLEWINEPDEQRFTALAHYLIFAPLFQQVSQTQQLPPLLTADTATELTNTVLPAELLVAALRTASQQGDLWWHHSNGIFEFAAAGNPDHPDRARVIVNLNDEPTGMTNPEFANSWQDWLLVSTILGFRNPNITEIVSNTSARDILTIDVAVPPPTLTVVAGPWQELIDETLDDTERDFVTQLSQHDIELPELGYETSTGTVIDIIWPNKKVGVILEETSHEDLQTIKNEGWQVLVTPEMDDVLTALKGS